MDATRVNGFVVGPGEGEARWYLGHLFDWKATGEQTGGRLEIVEVLAYRGGEPPLHVHSFEDEVFSVLEGRMTFRIGDDLHGAEPGSLVYAPRGVPHGFAIESETARMLITITPARLKAVFDAFSEPAETRSLGPVPKDPPYDAIERADAERGVTFVGPPLPALLAERA